MKVPVDAVAVELIARRIYRLSASLAKPDAPIGDIRAALNQTAGELDWLVICSQSERAA